MLMSTGLSPPWHKVQTFIVFRGQNLVLGSPAGVNASLPCIWNAYSSTDSQRAISTLLSSRQQTLSWKTSSSETLFSVGLGTSKKERPKNNDSRGSPSIGQKNHLTVKLQVESPNTLPNSFLFPNSWSWAGQSRIMKYIRKISNKKNS